MAMKQFVQRKKKKHYSPVDDVSSLNAKVSLFLKVFFPSIPVVLEVRETLAVE